MTVHIVIEQVAVSGLSRLDARRLLDQLRTELTRLAPDLAAAARSGDAVPRATVDAGQVPAQRRIERTAAPMAAAIVTAVRP